MSKTYAYLRVSTDKQDMDSQRLQILDYARRFEIQIHDYIEVKMSSRQTTKRRRIDELLEKLETGDCVIVCEMSRLGRSVPEVTALINELIRRKIGLVAIKENLVIKQEHDMQTKIMVTIFSLLAELERDLISLRTKEGLAAKRSQGVRLGKPKGTIQKSKFDDHRELIKELLGFNLSVRKIATHLGCTDWRALNTYIKKRRLDSKTASK